MVGLGLALARPDRRVAVITGDGDVLMALGSLATIGIKQPKNLSIVCLDNGHYSATGMQPSATSAGVDLAAAAAACRLRVEAVDDLSRAAELRALLHSGEGPLFIHARVDADDQKRIIPSRDGRAIKQRFMQWPLWRQSADRVARIMAVLLIRPPAAGCTRRARRRDGSCRCPSASDDRDARTRRRSRVNRRWRAPAGCGGPS